MISEGLLRLGFQPDTDFVVQDDGEGPYLKEWRSQSAQPSQDDIETAAALPPPYRRARQIAYRDELGKETGDYIVTMGDILDVLIAEIVTLGGGAPKTAEMKALVGKVQSIKQRFPQN